jgi:hypothetical protein
MHAARPPKALEDRIKAAAQEHGFPEQGGEKILPWDYLRKANRTVAKFVQI